MIALRLSVPFFSYYLVCLSQQTSALKRLAKSINSCLTLTKSIRPKTYKPKRLRPLARRAAITLRPPLVDIRTKKPCVRARRVFDG